MAFNCSLKLTDQFLQSYYPTLLLLQAFPTVAASDRADSADQVAVGETAATASTNSSAVGNIPPSETQFSKTKRRFKRPPY